MRQRYTSCILASSLALGASVMAQDALELKDFGLSEAMSADTAANFERTRFRRVASFPVFRNTDIATPTVAEIVAATDDGLTLIYTDSENGNVGFVDIADPSNPAPDGIVDLGGEPTAVSVAGDYALVGINTSPDLVNPSGQLKVVDINSRTIVRTIELGGQPDSVAVSPDGRYAAIAIENERDEELGDGEPPQLPGGFLVIVDLVGDVADWTIRNVDLTGVADLFGEDPEPEFVDINRFNEAVVTLQENNHCVIVRLSTGQVVGDFNAGTVDLEFVDTLENDLIEPESSLQDVPREPDAVSWTTPLSFVTADGR